MKLVDKTISLPDLVLMANKMFGGLVKAVVDIEKQIVVVDAGMHADEEQFLLEQGSKQENLWGINIYPKDGSFKIEFDSMINLRPSQNNFSRNVEDPEIQKQITELINRLIKI